MRQGIQQAIQEFLNAQKQHGRPGCWQKTDARPSDTVGDEFPRSKFFVLHLGAFPPTSSPSSLPFEKKIKSEKRKTGSSAEELYDKDSLMELACFFSEGKVAKRKPKAA